MSKSQILKFKTHWNDYLDDNKCVSNGDCWCWVGKHMIKTDCRQICCTAATPLWICFALFICELLIDRRIAEVLVQTADFLSRPSDAYKQFKTRPWPTQIMNQTYQNQSWPIGHRTNENKYQVANIAHKVAKLSSIVQFESVTHGDIQDFTWFYTSQLRRRLVYSMCINSLWIHLFAIILQGCCVITCGWKGHGMVEVKHMSWMVTLSIAAMNIWSNI